ncbi:uncharacterized protein GIQ15_02838 [Arthroderma uncinatum]|uniref:uncharacterized protein n=1 Tax=Arthroderma uncinatum TaxID=74035 RepID=UPI00144A5563|nr:uncharacterized protein GIQ15_02838 [Arthroderma uncinatum]KAF3483514.1 hypothetical protein GIQ15_02838 [Arthroderma uncinatum]
MSAEKMAGKVDADVEAIGEGDGDSSADGVVLDVSVAGTAGLKTAADGHTILVPQPSDSPDDPLNWSPSRKWIILLVISFAAFLPDYGSAVGAVTLLPQAEIWHMTPDEVNHSQAGNVFMLGVGGIVTVAFSAYFGRLPVLFWFMVGAVATAVWCTAAQSFESFMAARILNGFFSTVAQGGGLMFINDIFFFHEHARKINIWSSFIIVSPYLGPMLTAFIINTQIWQWAFGVYSIETGLCFIAIMIFMDETFYDRKLPAAQQPVRVARWRRMIGIEQWQSRQLRNSFKDAVMRPFIVICKPPMFISCLYYLMTFAWVVGINTTLAIFLVPLYGFGPKQIGFFYFTPVVAAILGEIVGHWLHDKVAIFAASRNQGHRFEPEARYIAIWISTPFILAGLVLLGFALEREYHYMFASLGWGLYVFGIMITTVSVSAYCLDSYPEASGEVAAWLNFSRSTAGFIVSYFMVRWAGDQGPIRQFGAMTGICAFAFVLIVVFQFYGKRIRRWSGPVNFKTL